MNRNPLTRWLDARRRRHQADADARWARRVAEERRRGGLGHLDCQYPLCDCPPNGPCHGGEDQ